MNRLKKHLTVNKPDRLSQARMVSLLSGKGGVGKSVVAFNLAERAAAAGYRVLLVDADLSCGNQHILANLDPQAGLDAFVTGRVPLAESSVTYNENLSLLARSQSGPLNDLSTVASVAQCARRLREETAEYNLVIIDHSSGISEAAAVFASASDVNLLVMVPELTSISDCYGLCKFLIGANRAVDCRLLLNRVDSDSEAEQVWTKFAAMTEQFLQWTPSLAGFLSEATAVQKSVASQQPIAEASPEAAILQELDRVVRNLMGEPWRGVLSETTTRINHVTATADITE